MSDRQAQLKKAKAKYMKNHKVYTYHLDTVQDAELIEWLEKQGNMSEAVRRILKQFYKFVG